MVFITIPMPSSQMPHEVSTYQHYLATCSLDGYLKIWDFKDGFLPIYEWFTSRKWQFKLCFDVTTLCLYCNGEGKHFPQRYLYLQFNKIVPRKYHFFTENILQTAAGVDHIYTSSINGIIYRLSKQDICRHCVKSKEKLKNR